MFDDKSKKQLIKKKNRSNFYSTIGLTTSVYIGNIGGLLEFRHEESALNRQAFSVDSSIGIKLFFMGVLWVCILTT